MTSPASTSRCPRPGDAAHRRPGVLQRRGRPRRPPRGRRARHPLLRLGPRRPVQARTSSRTSWPSTPPVGRRTGACAATRRSSSPRCSTRPALGFDAALHRALRPALRRASCAASVDPAKDQSYVLGVLRPTSWPAMFPLGESIKGGSGEGGGAGLRGGAEGGQPRHLLHPRRGHPAFPQQARSAASPARRRPETGATVGEHDGAYAFTVGQRTGLGAVAGRAGPRYVLGIEPVTRTVTIGTPGPDGGR